MKVAVISDIHGNMHALDAVLEDVARQQVDQLVCAGDIPNPFLRSKEAWLKIKGLGIPIVRGNHEDYIASYFSGDRPDIRESVQFLPIQIVARHLGPEIARELGALPFDHVINGPGGDDLYICHASPQHNARSFLWGVDPAMANRFEPVRARTVIAGHIHFQWTGSWQDKKLVIGGSVGLPHHRKPEAEYVVLTHRQGEWEIEMRTPAYDRDAALKEYRESEAFVEGGPMAWMLYDEILAGEARLAYFLPEVLGSGRPAPKTREEWARAAETYLRKIGRWDAFKRSSSPF